MDFILPIFPQGALAGSVFTTVWLGVWVIVFFNVRFGWVLSGLVVPGYIVPLLLIRPWSAAVIVVEAIATYFIVWLFSEKLSRLGLWNNVFGRDRFFALLLVSVVVRVVFETFLFPPLGQYLNDAFAIDFDYQNLLHSYGLIIVALIANQFWKPGLMRGLVPLGVTTATTFLLVRYGLMVFTNFSLGNIGYMYEDLAASMLASPKAYIILLATAFAASRMNLRYGWEFSGLLIPALLALQWYNPVKLAASFAEAFVILGIAMLILALPIFKNVTVEGGRKLLIFFNISFGYKLVLGYLILWFFPQYKITDYYAFGYLLATLLAIKMYDKQMLGQVTRATLQTSLVSVIVASFLGFSLQMLPNVFAIGVEQAPEKTGIRQVSHITDIGIAEWIQKNKVKLYRPRMEGSNPAPSTRQLEAFSYSIKQLRQYMQTRDKTALKRANALLAEIGYQVDLVKDQYLLIHERSPRKGWGVYVLNLDSENDLLLDIPAPREAWGTMDAGSRLFTAFKARALAIAGGGRDQPGSSNAALLNSNTLFLAFHQAMRQLDTLQVRGYTPKTVRQLTGKRVEQGQTLPEISSRLYIKSSLPAGLDLPALKSFIDEFDILWGKPRFENILRARSRSGFAELVLSRSDRRDLFFKPLFEGANQAVEGKQAIAGYIQDWLLQGKEWLAASGSNDYSPPSLEEMLYMDEAVLTPLVNVARKEYEPGSGWTSEGREELKAIQSAASVLDYEVIRYHHQISDRDYVILVERQDRKNRRYWGTYVLLLGQSEDFVVQIPRPLYEIRTFEFGIHLFQRLDASFLMIGGAHPTANTNRRSDLILPANKQNMFNLFQQVVLREAGAKPMFIAQCRGFGLRPQTEYPDAGVVMAFHSGINTIQQVGSLGENLIANLKNEGHSFRFVDGSPSLMGYEVGGLPQSEYLEQTINKRFALLWLSPLARKTYRQQPENRIQNKQFEALNIPTRHIDMVSFIAKNPSPRKGSVPNTLLKRIERYIETQDIVELDRIQHMLPEGRFKRLIDMNTKQAYLLVSNQSGQPLVLANLAPRQPRTLDVAEIDLTEALAWQFVQEGGKMVIWGQMP
ncbi:MAG: poly-gamma-glutamate biosynthesis protein PgsC/CapC [Desulfohalobiaceae bacterium]